MTDESAVNVGAPVQRGGGSGGAMGSQVQTEAPLPTGGPHSVPAIVLDHVSQLDDVLPFLVLLTRLKRMLLRED